MWVPAHSLRCWGQHPQNGWICIGASSEPSHSPGSSSSARDFRVVLSASAGMPMGSGARHDGHFGWDAAAASARLKQPRQAV